jgi:hypothetical protein
MPRTTARQHPSLFGNMRAQPHSRLRGRVDRVDALLQVVFDLQEQKVAKRFAMT